MKKLDNTSKEEIIESAKSPSGSQSSSKQDKQEKKSFDKKDKRFKKQGRNHNKRVNDPDWYVPNAQIAKDVASIPFAVYNGVTYKTFTTNSIVNKTGENVTDTTTPGVFVYKYTPWYGTATPTSALNLTMRALYSFVRHANAGKTNYEAPDLMLYIMAMDNVYLIIHEIKRLIRLAYYYNLENRDIPEKVFEVLNIDTTDLVGNLANYRAQLNTRIAKANSLAVPANFNIFKRRAVFGSVVLTDEPNRPTQLIIPQADGYYYYSATSSANGGELKYVQAVSDYAETQYNGIQSTTYMKKVRVDEYFKVLDMMLSLLLSDEDINIMSGDIIKAYGDNLYKLPFLEENELQEITHDQNLLLQFSNSIVLDLPRATFFGSTSDINKRILKFDKAVGESINPIISQAGGSLIAKVVLDYQKSPLTFKWNELNQLPITALTQFFLDTSESNSITPENIIEWSRLMMTVEVDNTVNNDKKYILEAGVEIGLGWLVGVPATYYNTANWTNQVKDDVKTVIQQFFQFSTVDYPGYRRPFTGPKQVPGYNLKLGAINYLQDEVSGEVTGAKSYRNRNNYFTMQAVLGLTYGPKHYLVAGIDYPTAYPTDRIMIYFDGSISKMYEKTAIVSPYNIKAMHDVALLGLISSPYITNK